VAFLQPQIHRLRAKEEWFSSFNDWVYFLTKLLSEKDTTFFLIDNDCRFGCLGLPRQSNNTAAPAIATANGFMFIE